MICACGHSHFHGACNNPRCACPVPRFSESDELRNKRDMWKQQFESIARLAEGWKRRAELSEGNYRSLAHAVCPDDSIKCHLELVDFCVDLNDALDKLAKIEAIEKERDALAAMVGEMREALKRQVETCCCGGQPCSRCKDSMAAVVLDLPQAAKIAEARKKLQQAWKGWSECDCEKNCCGDPDAWCKHFEPMREAFDECERLCSEKS